MVVLAIADEATIATLEQVQGRPGRADRSAQDHRGAGAGSCIKTAKPIYWITSGMHSPETGGPEMLMELAYRLTVEETPFIQNIRNNVITFITPVVEADGREKEVDTYYFNKKRAAGRRAAAADVLGQVRRSTTTTATAWASSSPSPRTSPSTSSSGRRPILHDLHEAQTYLYASTGTGPYNEALDPITIDEWWMLAENEVMEMTKRGVPGVWTYRFYDGWVPNYMFFIAHSHNAIGRFYEVQSYGPDTLGRAPRRHDHEPGVVPAESAARLDQVGPAQQHQHPGIGAALRAQPRGARTASCTSRTTGSRTSTRSTRGGTARPTAG